MTEKKTAAKTNNKATGGPAKTEAAKEYDTKRRQSIAAAQAALQEVHPVEYRALVNNEAVARGIEIKFRLSPQEKAQRQLDDLLREHPELANRVAPPDDEDDGPVSLTG